MENAELPGKYKHSCVAWYRKSHLAKMDGVDFDIEKKAKPASSTTDKMQESYSNKHNVT